MVHKNGWSITMKYKVNKYKSCAKVPENKKQYTKPRLISLGDIRDVTMGGSIGFGDSGASMPEKPF